MGRDRLRREAREKLIVFTPPAAKAGASRPRAAATLRPRGERQAVEVDLERDADCSATIAASLARPSDRSIIACAPAAASA